jgi:outer membrane protein assembly factor BamD
MFKKVKILVTLALAIFLSTSCSEYDKVLKEGSSKEKYDLAQKLYEEGKYERAINLFEKAKISYRGTPQAERITYFLAEANFKSRDYLLAAYYYETFVKSYPESSKLEEAWYKKAYCYYLDSPNYSLDQTNTKEAIKEMQKFINTFPASDKLGEANGIIQELILKLERKEFEIAVQYMKLEDYQAADIAFGNFLNDFPGSKYREDAYFMKFKSLYLYAANSFYVKQKERYTNAKTAFLLYQKKFPESEKMKEANEYFEKVTEGLNKIEENRKQQELSS